MRHLMTTVYIDNEPYVMDMRVRLVQESPDKETDNMLYYFTPEEIMSVKKVDTRRELAGGEPADTVLSRLSDCGAEDGASVGQRAAYGLGSAAAGILAEKLGNTGLLKSAYGSGLLKDPAVGTLGRLAYSAENWVPAAAQRSRCRGKRGS